MRVFVGISYLSLLLRYYYYYEQVTSLPKTLLPKHPSATLVKRSYGQRIAEGMKADPGLGVDDQAGR